MENSEALLRKIKSAQECVKWFAYSDEIYVLKGCLLDAEKLIRDSMPKKCSCECCCKNKGQSCVHDMK